MKGKLLTDRPFSVIIEKLFYFSTLLLPSFSLKNIVSMNNNWFLATKYVIWEVLKIAVTSFIIVWFVRHFLFQSFFVKGTSMEPNIHDRDYLIINEIVYRLHEPERGDIVVLRDKRNDAQFFIKRIIGLPGEKISVQQGQVRIYNEEHPDGLVLEENYLRPGQVTTGEKTEKLADNEYFVMGDNRGASLDSRNLGPFDRSDIVGAAWIRIWPLRTFGIIEDTVYTMGSLAFH